MSGISPWKKVDGFSAIHCLKYRVWGGILKVGVLVSTPDSNWSENIQVSQLSCTNGAMQLNVTGSVTKRKKITNKRTDSCYDQTD